MGGLLSSEATTTGTRPFRLIYFRGHIDEKDSAMITRICKDYETFSNILSGELAYRTLSNVYNLFAVRGPIRKGKLDMGASMSGPHHYFGHWDPYVPATVRIDAATGLVVYHPDPNGTPFVARGLLPVPDDAPVLLEANCNAWYKGKDMTDDDVLQWKIDISAYDATYIAEDGSAIPRLRRATSVQVKVDPSADSLFDHPGVLALNCKELVIPLLPDAYRYDLASFRVQLVRNDQSFRFSPQRLDAYKHAQHTLRIVTYHYGARYVPDYLMQGNGLFIERHDFIQAITPMTKQCGGFVVIGRDVVGGDIELLAIEIPFGFTLLVEPQALHGDSAMYGSYMMAMTGNHHAMGTADTVFLKDASTHLNATLKAVPYTSQVQEHRNRADEEEHKGENIRVGNHVGIIHPDAAAAVPLLLTSNVLSLAALHEADAKLKEDIIATVRQEKGQVAAMAWMPVIKTFRDGRTVGTSLPAEF